MEKETLQEFKKKFLEIQQSLMADANWSEAALVDALKGDEVDVSQEERARELQLKLEGRNLFYLKKIQGALHRIEDGTFGECEECGNKIALKRLQARPTANMCIGCKEEQERSEDHVLYHRKSHTKGRDLSSKTAKPAFGEWSGGAQAARLVLL